MGEIKVGTASWTDKTLLASGWYPTDADTPEKRLAYYAKQFPLVEVDATYYSPPAEQTAALWAQRTPPEFTFNIKAYSLLTGHPTKVSSIYKDLRPETDKTNVYPADLPAQAYEEVWTRFLSALDPLVQAGKLGAMLFQFPPWFTIRRSNKQYLLEVQKRWRRCGRCTSSATPPGSRATTATRRSSSCASTSCRTSAWTCRRATGRPSRPSWRRRPTSPSCGSTATATSGPARTSTRSSGTSTRSASWPNGRRSCKLLAEDTAETHVLMNNCYSDYAQRNAGMLADLLGDGDED